MTFKSFMQCIFKGTSCSERDEVKVTRLLPFMRAPFDLGRQATVDEWAQRRTLLGLDVGLSSKKNHVN